VMGNFGWPRDTQCWTTKQFSYYITVKYIPIVQLYWQSYYTIEEDKFYQEIKDFDRSICTCMIEIIYNFHQISYLG
jgi:hypothetical protein